MTTASATMIDARDNQTWPKERAAGILTIATGVAALVLLALHPGGDARNFADVLKDEAGHQLANAIVHGGFIVVLALQMVCYAVLSGRLGWQRPVTIAGVVFFAMGVAFFSASLLLDGLVTPAIAARYLAKPDKIESARVLLVLLGTLVSFLMPIALAFQSAAIAAWGWALNASGARGAGLTGLALGGLMIAAVIASFALGNPMALMGAIVAAAVWAFVSGTTMMRGTI